MDCTCVISVMFRKKLSKKKRKKSKLLPTLDKDHVPTRYTLTNILKYRLDPPVKSVSIIPFLTFHRQINAFANER